MNMNKALSSIATMLIMTAAMTGNALADRPANGFGLFAGLATHSMHATPSGPGASYNYSSSGMSIGVDYQFGVADNISINPFLMSSSERTSGDIVPSSAGHGIFGVQFRYWIQPEFFIGAHVASYSEILIYDSGASDSKAAGAGGGLAAGWENKSAGLIVSAQVDHASYGYTNARISMSAFRLQAGYRWK